MDQQGQALTAVIVRLRGEIAAMLPPGWRLQDDGDLVDQRRGVEKSHGHSKRNAAFEEADDRPRDPLREGGAPHSGEIKIDLMVIRHLPQQPIQSRAGKVLSCQPKVDGLPGHAHQGGKTDDSPAGLAAIDRLGNAPDLRDRQRLFVEIGKGGVLHCVFRVLFPRRRLPWPRILSHPSSLGQRSAAILQRWSLPLH